MSEPDSSVGKKICLRCRDPGSIPRLPTPVFLGFPWGSADKESTCNAGDLGSIPRLGRDAGERKGYPLYCSGLENSMDCVVHGVTKSGTRLSDFHFSGLSCSSKGKESACNAGDQGSIPGSGKSSGGENGNPLQYSCLENLMDRGVWRTVIYRVTQSRT